MNVGGDDLVRALDVDSLIVLEGDRHTEYERMVQPNGTINYMPKGGRWLGQKFMEEFLYLPIPLDIFMKPNEKKKFFGYRYEFSTRGVGLIYFHHIYDLEDSCGMVDAMMIVHRFIFHINKHSEIVIDKVCDPLSTPYTMEARGTIAELKEDIPDTLTAMVSELNEFYSDKMI